VVLDWSGFGAFPCISADDWDAEDATSLGHRVTDLAASDTLHELPERVLVHVTYEEVTDNLFGCMRDIASGILVESHSATATSSTTISNCSSSSSADARFFNACR